MRFLLGLMLMAVLVLGGYPWIDRHLPPGYHPFSPLSVDDPPTWITRLKLKRIKSDPAACMAVLMRAQAVGRITFREQSSSAGACPLDNPVRVTRFGPVALSASFLASCPLALSSAMLVAQAAAPQAQTLLGKRLERIDHVGSFACRNIYHRAEGRRSEHASAEALLEKYLNGEPLSESELKTALRQRTVANEIVPMLCGSAFKNKGVQALLDAVVDYLPSPVDVQAISGHDEADSEAVRHASDDEPFSALAFKIMTDPFVGQLIFFRVYSGVCRTGDTIYNPVKGKKERLGRLLQMHANERKDIKEVRAGDIVATVGMKDVTTGDTLSDAAQPIILERMVFPEPVISQAIEPKTKGDQEKMGIALSRLMQEDPSFRVRSDEESGQTIISGMGELHLEILMDRLRREFNVEVSVGKPQVAYRETLTQAVESVEGKFVKQSGGRGQYGHVVLNLTPQPAGQGYAFVDDIKGGVVPQEYIPAVDKGIQETLTTGVLGGYPVVDVKVALVFGSYHEVDSNENAFRMAASMAFKEGMRRAAPVLLEPMMAVEVETPEEFMGNVMGDLSSRRGMVQGMEDIAGSKLIRAEVPLAEMFGYSTVLRSMSQGRATYTMEFKHYAAAPRQVAEAVIKERQR